MGGSREAPGYGLYSGSCGDQPPSGSFLVLGNVPYSRETTLLQACSTAPLTPPAVAPDSIRIRGRGRRWSVREREGGNAPRCQQETALAGSQVGQSRCVGFSAMRPDGDPRPPARHPERKVMSLASR